MRTYAVGRRFGDFGEVEVGKYGEVFAEVGNGVERTRPGRSGVCFC